MKARDVMSAHPILVSAAETEAVLVRDADLPVGVITRADVLGIVRTALGQGVGRHHPRPTVIRLAGRAGAGKTTLIMRSLAHLRRFDAVVVQANGSDSGPAEGLGVREVRDPSAHWRAGFDRVVSRLADAELILMEDHDGPPDLGSGIGEDVQVAVVPVGEVGELSADRLADAQAVVVTHADTASRHEVQDAVASLDERRPGIAIFAVAPARDDRGLDEWVRWIRRHVMRRRG